MKRLQIVALVWIFVYALPAFGRESGGIRRQAAIVEVEAPACQGGYLAQTQAQDFLRDEIWVLEPVPGGSNRPYRFDCKQPVFLRR
jgi:hypothetical protein